MNTNVLTAAKDHDAIFINRLLYEMFSKDILAESCVRATETTKKSSCAYKELDKSKIDFIKGN